MAIDPNKYLQINSDVQKAYEQNSQGMTADQFANWHYTNYGQKEGRNTGLVAQAIAPDPFVIGGTVAGTPSPAPAPAPASTQLLPVSKDTPGAAYNPTAGTYISKETQALNAQSPVGSTEKQLANLGFTWVKDAQGRYQRSDAYNPDTGAFLFPELNGGQTISPQFGKQSGGDGSGFVVGGTSPGASSGLVSQAQQSSQQLSGFQPWGVTAPQTVQQQAADIVAADGTLMQQARGRAMQAMNERGLVNSTLAIQAGQDAVLDRAIQIAQQDAATNAEAAKFNAGQGNAWTLAQQELAEKASQFTRELAAKYDLAKFDLESRQSLAATEREYQQQLATDKAFQDQYQMYVDALFKIDSDPELSAEAKTARKQEQLNLLKNYASIRGLNLSQYLTFSTPTTTAPAPAPAAATGLVSQADNFGD